MIHNQCDFLGLFDECQPAVNDIEAVTRVLGALSAEVEGSRRLLSCRRGGLQGCGFVVDGDAGRSWGDVAGNHEVGA